MVPKGLLELLLIIWDLFMQHKNVPFKPWQYKYSYQIIPNGARLLKLLLSKGVPSLCYPSSSPLTSFIVASSMEEKLHLYKCIIGTI